MHSGSIWSKRVTLNLSDGSAITLESEVELVGNDQFETLVKVFSYIANQREVITEKFVGKTFGENELNIILGMEFKLK
jgi:hypothetical protein